jgi:hypothetical protein
MSDFSTADSREDDHHHECGGSHEFIANLLKSPPSSVVRKALAKIEVSPSLIASVSVLNKNTQNAHL